MTDRTPAEPSDGTLEAAARTEILRQSRLVDQATSMQSSLRDWHRALGTSLICIVLLASLLGLAFAFAGGDQQLTILGVKAERATWLGWLALTTFAISLLELVLDPRGAARRREQAVRSLAELKGEYRVAVPQGRATNEAARLSERYEAIMRLLPSVPEPLFNRLKAAHLHKVEISKILSDRPGVSVRMARKELRARLRR